jgi:hypothetical protein
MLKEGRNGRGCRAPQGRTFVQRLLPCRDELAVSVLTERRFADLSGQFAQAGAPACTPVDVLVMNFGLHYQEARESQGTLTGDEVRLDLTVAHLQQEGTLAWRLGAPSNTSQAASCLSWCTGEIVTRSNASRLHRRRGVTSRLTTHTAHHCPTTTSHQSVRKMHRALAPHLEGCVQTPTEVAHRSYEYGVIPLRVIRFELNSPGGDAGRRS